MHIGNWEYEFLFSLPWLSLRHCYHTKTQELSPSLDADNPKPANTKSRAATNSSWRKFRMHAVMYVEVLWVRHKPLHVHQGGSTALMGC